MPMLPRGAYQRFASGAVMIFSLLGIAAGSDANRIDVVVSITLASQPLGEALRELAKQANLQILFDANLVANHSTTAIKDTLSPRQALTRLLDGTELEAFEQALGVVVIRQRKQSEHRSRAVST